MCKSVDVIKDGILRPADWRFQEKATKWYQLNALVDFDRLYLIDTNKGPETLKRQLQVSRLLLSNKKCSHICIILPQFFKQI